MQDEPKPQNDAAETGASASLAGHSASAGLRDLPEWLARVIPAEDRDTWARWWRGQ